MSLKFLSPAFERNSHDYRTTPSWSLKNILPPFLLDVAAAPLKLKNFFILSTNLHTCPFLFPLILWAFSRVTQSSFLCHFYEFYSENVLFTITKLVFYSCVFWVFCFANINNLATNAFDHNAFFYIIPLRLDFPWWSHWIDGNNYLKKLEATDWQSDLQKGCASYMPTNWPTSWQPWLIAFFQCCANSIQEN